MKHRQRGKHVIISADVIESEDKETLNLRAELLLLLHTLGWGRPSAPPAAGDQRKSNVGIEHKFRRAQISELEAVQMGS